MCFILWPLCIVPSSTSFPLLFVTRHALSRTACVLRAFFCLSLSVSVFVFMLVTDFAPKKSIVSDLDVWLLLHSHFCLPYLNRHFLLFLFLFLRHSLFFSLSCCPSLSLLSSLLPCPPSLVFHSLHFTFRDANDQAVEWLQMRPRAWHHLDELFAGRLDWS